MKRGRCQGMFPYIYRWDRKGHKGQPCEVTARGTMSSIRVEFADVWQRFAYTGGIHLRRVHYQVLSTRSLTSNGMSYENTDRC